MAKKEIIPRIGRMHNPPHPGAVLKTLHMKPAKISVTDFAAQLGMDRKTVSRIINARCGVTAETALRLAKLLNTTPSLWLRMQADYDVWQAEPELRSALRAIRPLPRYHEEYQPGA